MDSVRFGRVLGTGARLAGRTLAAAVDAATAPNPERRNTPPDPSEAASRQPPSGQVVSPTGRDAGMRTVQQLRQTSQGVRRGGRLFGESVWRPFQRASGVLWLEVTGVFFGLIALFGLQGVWSYRGAVRGAATAASQRHLLLSAALALIFGYFCVSSFVRASRRGRRP